MSTPSQPSFTYYKIKIESTSPNDVAPNDHDASDGVTVQWVAHTLDSDSTVGEPHWVDYVPANPRSYTSIDEISKLFGIAPAIIKEATERKTDLLTIFANNYDGLYPLQEDAPLSQPTSDATDLQERPSKPSLQAVYARLTTYDPRLAIRPGTAETVPDYPALARFRSPTHAREYGCDDRFLDNDKYTEEGYKARLCKIKYDDGSQIEVVIARKPEDCVYKDALKAPPNPRQVDKENMIWEDTSYLE